AAPARGVFAAAVASAAGLRWAAEGVAERLRTGARADADRITTDAHARAKSVLDDAEHQAAALARRAQAEAERITATAETEAETIRRRAGLDAEQTRVAAEAEVERRAREVLAAAEADADTIRAEARQRAEAAAAQVLDGAREVAEFRRRQASELIGKAREREEEAKAMHAQAAAEMQRATSKTVQKLERQRLKDEAAARARREKEARKAEARRQRKEEKAEKPTLSARAEDFMRGNARRLMVVGPITAPMAVAWTGQEGFARDVLDWLFPFTLLFAAGWELSTTFSGWMYHQARSNGDSGTIYRIATWVFAGGAAVMNFWHASGEVTGRVYDPAAGEWVKQVDYWNVTPKAVSFAAMSIVGIVLWELYASLLHRQHLRDQGKVAAARPSIGLIRWLRYPRHSFAAWSLAITDESLTTLELAWVAAGGELTRRRALRAARRGAPLPASYRVVPISGSLAPADLPGFAAAETVTVERLPAETRRPGVRPELPRGWGTETAGTATETETAGTATE
ncbi:hypothetical protein ACFW9F_29245, partial [Streptomyces sp. NPDC059506]